MLDTQSEPNAVCIFSCTSMGARSAPPITTYSIHEAEAAAEAAASPEAAPATTFVSESETVDFDIANLAWYDFVPECNRWIQARRLLSTTASPVETGSAASHRKEVLKIFKRMRALK